MNLISIIVFAAGTVIGSFLNVCISRLPQNESIVRPKSHCVSCGSGLRPFDMVPIISYIMLRGKCRYCGAGIPSRHALVETLTGLVFVSLFQKYSLNPEFILSAALISILIVVFFIDMDFMIIPDSLVISGMIVGTLQFVYNIFYPIRLYGDRNWWNPLVGAVEGSGFLFIAALIGLLIFKTDEAMGGGDIKILAPIGLFTGWKLTIVILFLSAFIAGIAGIFLIAVKRLNRRSAIPFGPFIVVSTYISVIWGWDIINWYIKMLYI